MPDGDLPMVGAVQASGADLVGSVWVSDLQPNIADRDRGHPLSAAYTGETGNVRLGQLSESGWLTITA